MQAEKSAGTVLSKYNLRAFLAPTLLSQASVALTDSRVAHVNTELAGSRSPEPSQQKQHIKLKKKKANLQKAAH